MRLKQGTLAVAALVAIAGLLAACGETEQRDPVKLVPQGATLIAQVQLAKALEDADFGLLYAALPLETDSPQTFSDLLDEAVEKAGLDLRSVSDVILFAKIAESEMYGAVIARGPFEEAKLLQGLRDSLDTSFTVLEHRGYTIHADEDDEDGGPAFSLLAEDLLVLGNRRGVIAVIDVQDGASARVSGRLRDSFMELGDSLVRLAMEVPEEALEDIPSGPEGIFPFGGGGLAFGQLKDLEVIGVKLDKDGQTLELSARTDFASESSVSSFKDTVEGLLKLARGSSPDEETKELIDRVRLSTDDRRLSLSFEASVPELQELVGKLFTPSQEESREVEIEAAKPVPVPRIRESIERAIPAPVPGVSGPVPVMKSPEHIPVGESADYRTIPPTSGPHWAATAQCGVHDDPLPDELIVHNLEHGQVVISYNLEDPAETSKLVLLVQRLIDFGQWGVLRPYSLIEPGTVALAVWGIADLAPGVDADRIVRFYETHKHNVFSEESRLRGPIPCR